MLNDPVLVNDWHAVATVRDLENKNPLAVRLLGEDVVVWRLHGEIHAWQDLCIHRGTKLSMGKLQQDCLVCPYHGWQYDKRGQCVLFPAHPEQTPPPKARVTTYLVKEKYGLIWVSLGDPQHDIPAFPEWEDASYRKIPAGPYNFNAAAPRAIENFLDVAHFPFVHSGTLGDPKYPEIAEYEAIITDDGVVSEEIRVWQPDPDGTGQGAEVTYTYRVLRPLTAYFIKTKGASFAAYYVVSPIDELKSRAWILMAMDYGFEQSTESLVAFQDGITGEDIPIVESQRPELLPLDLQEELHLRSDRMAIAYRKWLRQLGVTVGTA